MNTEAAATVMPERVWFKSSYSTNEGGECIEVAAADALVHVRDSKNPQGPRLAFGLAEWANFLRYATGS